VIVPATARYATACPPIVTDPSVIESGAATVDAVTEAGLDSPPFSFGLSCAIPARGIALTAATKSDKVATRLSDPKSMFTSSVLNAPEVYPHRGGKLLIQRVPQIFPEGRARARRPVPQSRNSPSVA
jgi:hypothetical protein